MDLHALLASNQFLQGGLVLGIAGGIAMYAKNIALNLWDYTKRNFLTTIDVDNSGYQDFVFNNFLNSLFVITTLKNTKRLSTSAWKSSDVLRFGTGTHFFRYKGKMYFLRYSIDDKGLSKEVRRQISITTFLGKEELLSLIHEAATLKDDKDKTSISLYSHDGEIKYIGETEKNIALPQPKEYHDICNNVETFIKQKEKYFENNWAWRTGFLLYGTPGNGKTSLIHSVAQKFKSRIIYLDISRLNSNIFSQLSNFLQDNDIIVFEDADVHLDGRSIKNSSTIDMNDNKVNFADLLSLLDGNNFSTKGVIFFFTTNHKGALDDALIRPGRIDHHYCIGKPDKNLIKDLLNSYYSVELPDDILEDIVKIDMTLAELSTRMRMAKDIVEFTKISFRKTKVEVVLV